MVDRSGRPERRSPGESPRVVWFTGLSGAGKSTLALALAEELRHQGHGCVVLDGDTLRRGLCADLDFSPAGRRENLRRAGETARLLVEAGLTTLAAFISPAREDRERVRQIVGSERFVEVHVHCPLPVCEARDVKGLYARARAGEIKDFTGISAPYEAPESPALVLDTSAEGLDGCMRRLRHLLEARSRR